MSRLSKRVDQALRARRWARRREAAWNLLARLIPSFTPRYW